MTLPFASCRSARLAGELLLCRARRCAHSPLVLMGSGIGSISLEAMLGAIRGVLQAVVPARLKIKTEIVPLAKVEKTWNKDTVRSRVVFVMDQNSQVAQ